jgi:hypothetical protein
MPKIKIIYPAAGGAPDAEVDVDMQSLQHPARDHLVLDQAAGRRLIELFGNGYGDRHFTLVEGNMAFEGCRVVKMGADCTISYMRVGPYPPPAPVRIVIPTT